VAATRGRQDPELSCTHKDLHACSWDTTVLANTGDVCQNCGAHAKVLQCSRCKDAFYCSKSCQQTDWKRGHKLRCQDIRKRSPKAVTSSNRYHTDLDAAIAASLEHASDRTAIENAQISDALMRTANSSSVAVVVNEYSQTGIWFFNALSESPELEFIRQPPLPSGAKVYVKPDAVFEAVVQHLHAEGWDLKPRHVVTLSEHAGLVAKIVEKASKEMPRSAQNSGRCKSKRKTEVHVSIQGARGGSDDDDIPLTTYQDYVVKQTFVHVPIHSSTCSALSTHAATV